MYSQLASVGLAQACPNDQTECQSLVKEDEHNRNSECAET